MECRTARELLDSARPDSADREDAELQAAFAHLDECEACAEVLEFRRQFDRRVGEIVRDVPVPADLRARLQQAFAPHASNSLPRPAEEVTPRQSRRALMLATSAAALLIAAGWSVYLAHSAPTPLAATDVLEWWQKELAQPDFRVSALPKFDGHFDATVGDGRWLSRATSEPRGADLNGDGTDDAAVFQINGGFFVVFAPNRVSNPPAASSANSAPLAYTPVPHVAWTHNGSMHICFLTDGTPDQLQQLLQRVYAPAA